MNANKTIKILIADDDWDDIVLLKETLQNIFPLTDIVDVSDGIAALRHIKTCSKPDLVFLDLNMPLENGLNCLKDIFNLELLPNVPIIIYSTSNNIKDIDEAYKYNASFYVIKPNSYKVLNQIIEQLIKQLEVTGGQRVDKENFVLSKAKLLIEGERL